MIRTLHHISDLGATQRSASKIVVSIKKRKPNLGFLGISAADRINTDFAQFAQRTTEFSNIRLNGIDPRALKAIESSPAAADPEDHADSIWPTPFGNSSLAVGHWEIANSAIHKPVATDRVAK